ncbi:ATP dependent DNA ligase [Mesobacillus foraminis]|uniref:ATP dependent DNA ligase n=1 Tax=Mesobacillus foraminis TaxID=279826 RepID=UPI00105228A1|nr:hypothetical protein [Mesobacillus foraminis]
MEGTDQSPFKKRPRHHHNTTWVMPKKTVKINYAEWTEGGALRQPSIEGVIEVPSQECLLERI